MINQAARDIIDLVTDQLRATGWGATCNNLGLFVDGRKVVARPERGGAEYTYIGIEDTRGTYLYFRENSSAAQVNSEQLGSCNSAQRVSMQLRVVAVSNNLQNTPQLLADKLFVDLLGLNLNLKVQSVSDIDIDVQNVWTNHADIMLAETDNTKNDAARIALAAIDFTLSFLVNPCKLQPIKLC